MFDATISAQALQSSVRALAAVVDETILVVNKDGMLANAVDASNASLASLDLSEGAFIEYNMSDAEIGIDLRRLLEIITMAGKDDNITLELDDETHKLCIGMTGLSYTMSLLDPSSMRKSPQVPELDLPVEVVLLTGKFKQAVKAAYMVSDTMVMGVDGETFYMEAKGDTDAVRLELIGEDLISLKSGDVNSQYSLDYLNDMVKGIGATPEITINLGRDLPMVLDFSPYPRCDATYLLAPRISPD